MAIYDASHHKDSKVRLPLRRSGFLSVGVITVCGCDLMTNKKLWSGVPLCVGGDMGFSGGFWSFFLAERIVEKSVHRAHATSNIGDHFHYYIIHYTSIYYKS
jgi:hypothetical protein